jgi:hypothetical protein
MQIGSIETGQAMLHLTASVKHQDAGYVRRLGQVWGRHCGQDVKSKPLGAEVPAKYSTACFTRNSTLGEGDWG